MTVCKFKYWYSLKAKIKYSTCCATCKQCSDKSKQVMSCHITRAIGVFHSQKVEKDFFFKFVSQVLFNNEKENTKNTVVKFRLFQHKFLSIRPTRFFLLTLSVVFFLPLVGCGGGSTVPLQSCHQLSPELGKMP